MSAPPPPAVLEPSQEPRQEPREEPRAAPGPRVSPGLLASGARAALRREGVVLGLLLALALGVRLWLALATDVYFDEAYYWVWGRALDWGYFDHAPLVAWAIALVGVRPTALLCGVGATLAVYGLATDVHGSRRAGLWAAALFSATPAATLAGTFATPDSPLLLFWALTLWAVWRQRWGLAGLAAGLAALSKYSAVLLGAAVLVAAVQQRRLPRGAWGALLLALLLFSPVVLWNAQHEWVSFAFQLKHGLGGSGGLASLGEYAAGQLAMGGPVLTLLAVGWCVRGPRAHALLRAATWVPLLAFAVASWRTRGEANWPAPAWVAASVGLSGLALRARPWALGSGLLVVLAVGSHLVAPLLSFERDVTLSRTHGWAELSRLRTLADAQAVFAPSYQLAAEATYYAGLPADVVEGRLSQYDVWPPLLLPRGAHALWLSEGGPPPASLRARFSAVEGPHLLPADFAGRRVHTFHVWVLKGAHGPPPGG